MPNSRETIQLNTETHLRNEITMQEELKRLNLILENLLKRSEERDRKVDEMYDYFIKGGNVVWFIKWVFGTAVAIGGLILMVKSIINGQN